MELGKLDVGNDEWILFIAEVVGKKLVDQICCWYLLN